MIVLTRPVVSTDKTTTTAPSTIRIDIGGAMIRVPLGVNKHSYIRANATQIAMFFEWLLVAPKRAKRTAKNHLKCTVLLAFLMICDKLFL